MLARHLARPAAILVAAATLLLAPAAAVHAASGPALTVDAGADRHPIAPEIYGMSFADPALAEEIDLPLSRWGGNTTDRYNWRIDTWNTGEDWFFENISGCWNDAGSWCSTPPANPAQGYRRIIDGDRAVGARTLLTLPMVGNVAGRPGTGQPLPCSFPTSVTPAQDEVDRYAPCGNGLVGGRAIAPGADVGTPSGPQLSVDWIGDIRSRYGADAVSFYGLGNEPMLWPETHRDVHPAPTSYDELRDKSVALATAAKQADPAGATLGPSEWGWPNYFCSALDGAPEQACDETTGATLPDRAAHGGEPLAAWYLDRMRAASESAGKRLLDYFDLHYYAQGGGSTDVTRSLWDPSYTDPSWIGRQIALLPRMRAWVGDHYPGTKLALSEYDLSLGGDAVTDTLIQADVLGIFAREQVGLAARWDPPTADETQANAFRLYRDYDGAGGRFGDLWARSLSGDQGRVAVYAATRAADGALTIALVNKSAQPQDSPLTIAGLPAGVGSAAAWQWSGGVDARPHAIADVALQAAGNGSHGATVALPARSLTMLVVTPPRSDPPPGGDDTPDTPTTPVPPPPSGGSTPTPPGDAITPAPLPRPPVRRATLPLADRVGLPSAARCVRATKLSFRLRSPTTRRLQSAVVGLRGGRARVVGGPALKRTIVVGGLPRRGRFTLTVRLRLSGDRRQTVAQRRYLRCR
ncbi:glycoside hydrolase family 44 protein [Conexibacter sp. JD483]|uniref:glycoside hydrolase family 44 protein n=1 Tax=unclassified Conexibacter TaxID=2627773 RepID=UPI002725BC1E|nr:MULTISPECIES: glycoside hydrolase family 44 protein [unclassified Conexibacter]MDO8185067.1 glycoside hydrolase family 44 protein [Conexibacter sp. CPCC 205706]MDO8196777.1 glycoside hydrolase family 44 protein [Conexibacter sp. CPCC 205762]MDR9368025.1 glycoside hydrolase family 44 protein [Conexibacter sp. JD483]